MRRVLCVFLAVTLSLVAGLVNAKAYKGAEIYSSDSYLYGRYEIRMRVANASGVLSTFFTYKDGSEVARLAHQLKGLALVMTAVKLSENATSAEKLCNQTKELGEVLTKLEDDFYRVREYLATHPQFSTL